MLKIQLPPAIFRSPPLFSAHWLGRHPLDGRPRVIECVGPSTRDANSAVHASVLGLKPASGGRPPSLSRVSAEFDGQGLVLFSRGQAFLRTGPLPAALAAALRWRAELLLAWVDIPLLNPRAQISMVGVHHVWTGIVPVDGTDQVRPAAEQGSGAGEQVDLSSSTDQALDAVRMRGVPSPPAARAG